MYKAAFLDVDGVIRHNNKSMDGGPYYNLDIDNIRFIDGALEAHRLLYEANVPVFWVTMQNCISEGLISYVEVSRILEYMQEEVIAYGGYVQATFVCLSADETKKSKALAKYNAITQCDNVCFSTSLGVGDDESDILAYNWVGIGNIYHIVLPYAGSDYRYEVTAASLLDAVQRYLCIV